MLGRWVVVSMYGQQPVAGYLASASVAGKFFFALLVPTKLHGPLDVRLFGVGARRSMQSLAGGLAEAIAFNNRDLPAQCRCALVPLRRTSVLDLPKHTLGALPTARSGLN